LRNLQDGEKVEAKSTNEGKDKSKNGDEAHVEISY